MIVHCNTCGGDSEPGPLPGADPRLVYCQAITRSGFMCAQNLAAVGDMPWPARPVVAPAPLLERDVVRAALRFLQAQPDCFAWRNNVGGQNWTDTSGKERYTATSLKGSADVLALVAPLGRLLCVELKRPDGKGKQSAAQEKFERLVTRVGAVYVLEDDPKLPKVRAALEALRRAA